MAKFENPDESHEADYFDEEDNVSTNEVYTRAYAHFGNHELAREATELYPGDFI